MSPYRSVESAGGNTRSNRVRARAKSKGFDVPVYPSVRDQTSLSFMLVSRYTSSNFQLEAESAVDINNAPDEVSRSGGLTETSQDRFLTD
jgi:hypothetical protein